MSGQTALEVFNEIIAAYPEQEGRLVANFFDEVVGVSQYDTITIMMSLMKAVATMAEQETQEGVPPEAAAAIYAFGWGVAIGRRLGGAMRGEVGTAHPLDPEDWDWRAAFQLAGREAVPKDEENYYHYSTYNEPHIQPCAPGVEVGNEEFTRADIAEVEAFSNGKNDGPDWLCFGKLNDSRWFMLRAGCDYTGWDCQSGGLVDVAPDRETLLRYGVTKGEAERLGLPVSESPKNPDW